MSDAHRDEITKLEALYEEHPEGRIFTHLAEAYRKAGELERAREVLEDGIHRHPDYSSAHVVLGRVSMDEGRADEAATEFQRVLDLDPHNMIATRSLGDLARAQGDDEAALEYYNRLLAQDPSSEVQEIVDEMTQGDAAEGGVGEAEIDVPEWGDTAGVAGDADADSDTDDDWLSSETGTPDLPDAASPWDDEPDDDSDWSAEGGWTDHTEGWGEDDEPEPDAAAEAPVSEEEPSPFGAWDESEPTAEAADEADADFGEWGDLSEVEEPDTEPEATGSWQDEVEKLETEMDLSADLVTEDDDLSEAVTEDDDLTADLLAEDDDLSTDLVESAEIGDEESEVRTETIAWLYARQGLYDRAAEVYRELLRDRPNDTDLLARLSEMEERAEAQDAEPVAADAEASVEAEPVDLEEPDEWDFEEPESMEFGEPVTEEAELEEYELEEAEDFGLEVTGRDSETGLLTGAELDADGEDLSAEFGTEDIPSPPGRAASQPVREYFGQLLAWTEAESAGDEPVSPARDTAEDHTASPAAREAPEDTGPAVEEPAPGQAEPAADEWDPRSALGQPGSGPDASAADEDPDAETDPWAEAEADPDAEADPWAETEPEPEEEPALETDPWAEAEPEPEEEPALEPDPWAEPEEEEPEAETDPWAEPEPEEEPALEPDPWAEAEPEPAEGPALETDPWAEPAPAEEREEGSPRSIPGEGAEADAGESPAGPASGSSSDGQESAAEDDDDLEMFRSWLESLKQ